MLENGKAQKDAEIVEKCGSRMETSYDAVNDVRAIVILNLLLKI
jgi:hypothetical protein